MQVFDPGDDVVVDGLRTGMVCRWRPSGDRDVGPDRTAANVALPTRHRRGRIRLCVHSRVANLVKRASCRKKKLLTFGLFVGSIRSFYFGAAQRRSTLDLTVLSFVRCNPDSSLDSCWKSFGAVLLVVAWLLVIG